MVFQFEQTRPYLHVALKIPLLAEPTRLCVFAALVISAIALLLSNALKPAEFLEMLRHAKGYIGFGKQAGLTFTQWFQGAPGLVVVASQAATWLKEWGLDLSVLGKDHEIGNLGSFACWSCDSRASLKIG